MPNAAIIAAALTDASAHPVGIFIDSLDVVEEPSSHRYGVVWDSIRINEAGPGGVSSMSFTIDDPSRLITIATNAVVFAYDFTNSLPMFLGWVQSVDTEPAFGQRGRFHAVTAFGIESILDNVIVPTFTMDLGAINYPYAVLQSFASSAPLRALANPPNDSSQAFPLGTGSAPGLNWTGSTQPDLNGLSIRRAWDSWWAANQVPVGFSQAVVTVDFYSGLRLWGSYAVDPVVGTYGTPPTDYADITLTEALGSAGASLKWSQDSSPGTVVTAVYVKGSTAAGTGWVTGDTSQGRYEAYVSDTTAVDDATKRAVAAGVLNRKGSGAGRGTVVLEHFTPVAAHPGSLLTITNTGLGWAAKKFVIAEIEKVFDGPNAQNWTLTFFEQLDRPSIGRASAMAAIKNRTLGAPS